MSTALLSGLIILVLLVIMLIAGVPIAVALGISSILRHPACYGYSVAVLTGAQRIFSGISVFSLLGYTVLYPGRQYHEQGRHRSPSDQSCEISHRPCARRAGPHKCGGKHAFWRPVTAAASAMGSIIGPIEKDEGYDPNFSAAANIATVAYRTFDPSQQRNDHFLFGQRRNLCGSSVYGRLYPGYPLGSGLYGSDLFCG